MATSTIRIDEGIKEEASRIANEMGLSFNAVVNILLRKFNSVKGFPFPVVLEEERKRSVFDLNSDEFDLACKAAVSARDPFPVADYVTLIDPETGKLMQKYADGRVEYVLD
ncbi:MAG: type II toxin-antitoxin system RelB/DinJ family antitoxin [Lachnospiraceae bacterium]|nr:type II toxin-antitoxin system RelB/DinJ family antitoxin [Lachnospiraceae bacterium]